MTKIDEKGYPKIQSSWVILTVLRWEMMQTYSSSIFKFVFSSTKPSETLNSNIEFALKRDFWEMALLTHHNLHRLYLQKELRALNVSFHKQYNSSDMIRDRYFINKLKSYGWKASFSKSVNTLFYEYSLRTSLGNFGNLGHFTRCKIHKIQNVSFNSTYLWFII